MESLNENLAKGGSVRNVRGNTKETVMPGGMITKRQRVVTVFRCKACGTDYHALISAERCAAMPVEPRLFKKGDRVTWREPAVCQTPGKKDREFRIKATVIRVRKPEPPDEEYNHKWLGGKLSGMHVRQYEVAFKCPCGKQRSMLLYAAEMEKLP